MQNFEYIMEEKSNVDFSTNQIEHSSGSTPKYERKNSQKKSHANSKPQALIQLKLTTIHLDMNIYIKYIWSN